MNKNCFLEDKMEKGLFLLEKKHFIFFFGFCLISFNLLAQSGQGVIDVNSGYSYTEYRNVTRTREVYVPGVMGSSFGGTGGQDSSIRTETYTVREPVTVTDDYNLRFWIYDGDFECYAGRTPVRISGFDPGKTYRIVWIGRNGVRKEGTITVPNTRPFTNRSRIE